MKGIKLDDIIQRDIQELFAMGKISAAEELNPVMKARLKAPERFSCKGLPQYFTGNRKGKTVMVNLNPGMAAEQSDAKWEEQKEGVKGRSIDWFIEDLMDQYSNFGLYDKDLDCPDKLRYDEFDVKQAAFLTPWKNSGINLPAESDWSDKDACIEAKTKVLCNKYQLELVPYASSKFAINNKEIHLFRPYVETLLNEIFSQPREYIIFASAIFERIFKDYNKIHPDTFDLSKQAVSSAPLKVDGKLKGKCKVITINYQGNSHKALIAHTFPSQALCRAFDLMQIYGEFCYSEFIR